MEDTLVEQGVAQAAQAASNSVQSTIDELENASSKAEADAVIDKMQGIDDSQKVLLKSQITKQFEDGGDVTTTKYLTLAYLDMYKKQAIDKDKISEMLSSIDKISLDADNAAAIIEEAFDNYYGSLTPDSNNMVPVKDLPPVDDAINKAITNHSSDLFEDFWSPREQAKRWQRPWSRSPTSSAAARTCCLLTQTNSRRPSSSTKMRTSCPGSWRL